MLNVNKLVLSLLIFGLLASEDAFADLREKLRVQNAPKPEVIEPDVEAFVDDIRATWHQLRRQGDAFLIMHPSNISHMQGAHKGKIFIPHGYFSKVALIFAVDDYVFGAKQSRPIQTIDGHNAEVWKGKTLMCELRPWTWLTRPDPYGVIDEEGFVSFRSEFTMNGIVRRARREFQVNFKTGECLFKDGDIKRCHVMPLKEVMRSHGEQLNNVIRSLYPSKRNLGSCQIAKP